MDQAGNLEIPKPDTTFTIIEDTTPPTTTSNAYASYYNGANIILTATDNSSLGVKTTYYQLNGGPIQTGRTVLVLAVNGVFEGMNCISGPRTGQAISRRIQGE